MQVSETANPGMLRVTRQSEEEHGAVYAGCTP